MGLPKLKAKISVADYLASEKTSLFKREYLDGEVFAMVENNKNHNRIVENVFVRLMKISKVKSIEIYFAAVKVQIKKLNRFYYPDLIVVCGEDNEDEYFTTKPAIIIEVLSPSTALTDRREKMFAYQEIESLQEYVLIEQNRIYAEIYRRRDDGLWSYIEFDDGEEIEFAPVNFKMLMREIYEGIELPAENQN